MPRVTIQVIEGLERGRVYADLTPPVSIGREDDNSIRLNDERVSRFHAKLQEDGNRIILTDLDSTNGTRVNGHPVQMRVMQIGDQVSVGRCLLIFGSRDEIALRLKSHHSRNVAGGDSGSNLTVEASGESWESEELLDEPVALDEPDDGSVDGTADTDANLLADLFPQGPPGPPRELRPVQRAEVSDMVAYVHEQIRAVLHAASEEQSNEGDAAKVMRVDWPAWQRLLSLEMDLAVYLREIADPEA